MGIADIQAAINSIPAKKEDLHKAFEDLESHSSFLASFTLQWKDIDDHLSSVEKSIDKRFQELKAKMAPEKPTAAASAANARVNQDTEPRPDLKDSTATVSAANAVVNQDKPVIEPPPELKSLCVKMDAKGLRSYIIAHRENYEAMRSEIGPALLSSPDPVTLVLDSFDGFVPSSGVAEGIHSVRRACLTIMDCFHGLKLEIKPSDKERARRVAEGFEDLITDGKRENGIVVLVFLHLIVKFGLFEYFAIGNILDLLVMVTNRKNVVDLCRNSALEEKIPDLIYKLNDKGRQLDSLKFVVAFNLLDKFPVASLFKSYLKESKRKGVPKGDSPQHPQRKHDNFSEQIAALRAAIKAVEEYNLGPVYVANFQNSIEQLKKQRSENKRGRTGFASIEQLKKLRSENKRGRTAFADAYKQQHQPLNKRPRPATVLPLHPHAQIQPQPMPLNSASTGLHLHPHSQNQPQFGLVDQSAYMDLASSHGLIAAPSLYNLGNPIGPGASLAPPKSFLYPSQSPAGSAYYDRPVSYPGYPNSAFPPAYNPSPYP